MGFRMEFLGGIYGCKKIFRLIPRMKILALKIFS